MNQLPEHITDQINKEAEKYGFRVPYDGSMDYYNEDRVKGYQDGATPYAVKWQQAEEMIEKMAEALQIIENPILHLQKQAEKEGGKLNGVTAYQLAENAGYLRGFAVDALTEYYKYKQANNVTE